MGKFGIIHGSGSVLNGFMGGIMTKMMIAKGSSSKMAKRLSCVNYHIFSQILSNTWFILHQTMDKCMCFSLKWYNTSSTSKSTATDSPLNRRPGRLEWRLRRLLSTLRREELWRLRRASVAMFLNPKMKTMRRSTSIL